MAAARKIHLLAMRAANTASMVVHWQGGAAKSLQVGAVQLPGWWAANALLPLAHSGVRVLRVGEATPKREKSRPIRCILVFLGVAALGSPAHSQNPCRFPPSTVRGAAPKKAFSCRAGLSLVGAPVAVSWRLLLRCGYGKGGVMGWLTPRLPDPPSAVGKRRESGKVGFW